MKKLHLIRDVLDNQLVDRQKRKMGKVDGLVLVLRKDKPPRVAYVEVGMSTLCHRLHLRLGHLAEKIGHKLGVREGAPYRIPWSKVRHEGIDVEVDLDVSETPIMRWEKWLNKKIIGRIPGGG